MAKMKFSIIGCQHAHIGIFIEEMLSLGHHCTGIYEPDNRPLAEHLAQKYGLPLAGDPETLLAADVVGCASVNQEKMDVIELCERHGKPIMIDKPAVTSREGLDRLRRVFERGRIQVGMLLTERFRPEIRLAREWIERGELGELVHISMRKPHRLNPESRPAWHFSKDQSGGIIIDLLVHDFDLLRFFTGQEVSSSSGFMSKSMLPEHPTFYDAAGLQVVMDQGITAQLYADWHTPPTCWTWGDGRIFLTGTRGTAEIRLEGDPFLGQGGVALYMNAEKAWTRAEGSDALAVTCASITEDFLSRIIGGPHVLSHRDILAATEATITADETAERICKI